jgi:hypothetical protein
MGHNMQLKSEVERLTGSVNRQEAEIVTLRGELADLAEVKNQLISVVQENKILEEKLNDVINESKSTRLELISV